MEREIILTGINRNTNADEQISRRESLSPNQNEAVFFTPEDVLEGRLRFGFNGQKADAIVIVNAGGVANGGPATQILQASECARRIAEGSTMTTHYIGPQGAAASHVVESITGVLPEQIAVVPSSDAIVDRYNNAYIAMKSGLERIFQEGKRKIVIISNGYTGYTSWGTKKAVNELTQEEYKDVEVKIIIQDSSFPDTDNPNNQTTDGSIPIDRFALDAYKSNGNVEVYFLMNNWLPVDPQESRNRAPAGIIAGTASFPFTPQYYESWLELRNTSKQEARYQLSDRVTTHPDFQEALRDLDTIIVPFFASSGYFDDRNVGKWMTEEQFEDMQNATMLLIDSLSEVSRRTGRKIALTAVPSFVHMARTLCPEIFEGEQSEYSGLKIIEVPPMSQDNYRLYGRTADIGIFRTSQTNTMPEIMATGVPAVLLTAPAHGYMSVETMDRLFREIGGVHVYPHTPQEDLIQYLRLCTEYLDYPEFHDYQELQVRIQDGTLLEVHNDSGRNFMNIAAHISGVRLDPRHYKIQ